MIVDKVLEINNTPPPLKKNEKGDFIVEKKDLFKLFYSNNKEVFYYDESNNMVKFPYLLFELIADKINPSLKEIEKRFNELNKQIEIISKSIDNDDIYKSIDNLKTFNDKEFKTVKTDLSNLKEEIYEIKDVYLKEEDISNLSKKDEVKEIIENLSIEMSNIETNILDIKEEYKNKKNIEPKKISLFKLFLFRICNGKINSEDLITLHEKGYI